jgi:NADH:ubiquinone oxidoreductase subunit C
MDAIKIMYSNSRYSIYLSGSFCSYFLMHVRFVSITQPINFIDCFAYNINFFNFLVFYNFRLNFINYLVIVSYTKKINVYSAVSLFTNINWYEREIFELNGIYFFNKLDNRNLVLPYCFNDKPLQQFGAFTINTTTQKINKNFIHNLGWTFL